MQLNSKSQRHGRATKTLNTTFTQAQYIASQIALERQLAKEAKCGTRAKPSIRKFSWED